MCKPTSRAATLVVAAIAMVALSARGQGILPSGSLSGIVVDTRGSGLAGVRIAVKNNASGTTSDALTTSEGRFTLSNVPAGTYTVSCAVQGFVPAVLSDVSVTDDTPTTVRLVLRERQAGVEQTPPPPPSLAAPVRTPPALAQPATAPPAVHRPEPSAPPARAEAAQKASSWVNVRVDVTLSDQTATGRPTKKMISATVVEGGRAQVRSGVSTPIVSTTYTPTSAEAGPKPSPIQSYNYRDMGLSLDVTVLDVVENRVRLRVTVEYNPVDEKTIGGEGFLPTTMIPAGVASFTKFSQSLDVALTSGEPLVVAASSDPVPNRDRIASLEVKATILK